MLATSISTSLLATAAIAVACAALSVFVVARRWAFIGEGISHSGFGGAGMAWLAMLALPTIFDRPWMPYVGVIVFSIATAMAIGYLSRGNRVTGDAAIGIFLVASLAFGFLAQQIFTHVRHTSPAGFESFLFGQPAAMSGRMALAPILVSFGVVATLVALGKEIIAYCFDPLMAQASGVRAGTIHYVLMALLAVVIIVGMPITGSVLVTALLVLPGVTASMLSRRLNVAIIISMAAGLTGAITGVAVHAKWRFVPTGPAIVLTLFAIFIVAWIAARITNRAT
jgi:manganese/iron transport system permease protein